MILGVSAILTRIFSEYPFIRDFGVLTIAFLVLAAVNAVVLAVRPRPRRPPFLLPLYSISTLGLFIGILTGTSRSPAADATIPAILSLAGGLVTYLFAKRPDVNYNAVAAALVALAVTLGYGSYIGSALRVQAEISEHLRANWYEEQLASFNAKTEMLRFLCEKELTTACDAVLNIRPDTSSTSVFPKRPEPN